MGDHYYATRIRQLVRIDLDEAEARALWHEVYAHRRELERRLGRDVGQHVALLDYVVNVRRRIADPQIIERATLETIEHQALADALTGLYNRWYFDAALVREIERCRRYGARSALLLFDVDRFKSINDQHGHTIGDAVLRMIGAVVRRHLRTVDIPCRHGGDEFAVLLPDTAESDAMIVAERIGRDAGVSCAREIRDTLSVTLSGGVAALTRDGPGADGSMSAADAALYLAKRIGQGRGRVMRVAPPETRDAPGRI